MRYALLLAAMLPLLPVRGDQANLASAIFTHEAKLGVLHETVAAERKALADQYGAALKALQLKVQSEGDLDKLKQVRAEEARFSAQPPAPPPPHPLPELNTLAATYAKRTSEIERKEAGWQVQLAEGFDAELAALQKRLTQAGQIDQASAVQAERQKSAQLESLAQAKARLALPADSGPPPPAPPRPAPTPAPLATWYSPQVPAPNPLGWMTLFDGRRLYGWNPEPSSVTSGKILVEDGVLRLDNTRIFLEVPARDVMVRVRLKKVSGQNASVGVRQQSGSGYVGWFNGGRSFGIGKLDPSYRDLRTGSSSAAFPDYFDLEFSVQGTRLVLKANETQVVATEHTQLTDPGRILIGSYKGLALIKRIEVRVLDTAK
jgi:hypothetical protein